MSIMFEGFLVAFVWFDTRQFLALRADMVFVEDPSLVNVPSSCFGLRKAIGILWVCDAICLLWHFFSICLNSFHSSLSI